MSLSSLLVAPSLLAADFSQMGLEARRAVEAGGDWLHLDVMDGHFVDNISFGPAMVRAIREVTPVFLDVHLMISRPDHYLDRFIAAGAGQISVHVEAEHDIAETLGRIRKAGLRAGLAFNPATSLDAVKPFYGQFDTLLCMTVVPGFGGQSFLPEVLPKVEAASADRTSGNFDFEIEVDGGIDAETAPLAARAGARIMVAGSSVFRAPDRAAAISAIRRAGDS